MGKTSNFANLLKIIAVIIIASTIGVLAYYAKPLYSILFKPLQLKPQCKS